MSNEQSSIPFPLDAPTDHPPMVNQLLQAGRGWLYGHNRTAHKLAEEEIAWHRANIEAGREATLREDSYGLKLLESGQHAVSYGDSLLGVIRLYEALHVLDRVDQTDSITAARMRAHRYTAKAIWGLNGDLGDAEAHLQSAFAVGVLGQSPENLRLGEEQGNVRSFIGRLEARKFGAGIIASLDSSIEAFRLADDELTEEIKITIQGDVNEHPQEEVRTKGTREDIQTNANYLSLILGVAGHKEESLRVMKRAARMGIRRWENSAAWLFTTATFGIYFTEGAQRKIVNKLVR